MPLRETFCDPVPALSNSVSVALRAPTEFGMNATPKAHDDLGATVTGIAPHVPVPLSANSNGSDETAPEMISELAPPVFLTVRFFVSVCPTGTLPKESDVVTDTEVVGVAVGVPVAVGVVVGVPVSVGDGVGVSVAVGDAVAVAVAVGGSGGAAKL